jgi:antitoxin component YwqK of YwqJK toxin-antitoxin module
MKKWLLALTLINNFAYSQNATICKEIHCKTTSCSSIKGLFVTNLDVVPVDFSGVVYMCENGFIRTKLNYINGKPNGFFYSYHENGNIQSFGELKAGEKTGKWVYFYDNLFPSQIENYISGMREGPYVSYYESGVISCKGFFKNDAENGEFTNYWENGNLSSKGTLINGLGEGEWYWYRQDGALGYVQTLKNDKVISCKGECN